MPLSIRQTVLVFLTGAITLGATITIYAFLFGGFGWLTIRVLASTLVIALCSLAGLATTARPIRQQFPGVAAAGMICAALSTAAALTLIWHVYDTDTFLRLTLTLFAATGGLTYSSLVLHLTPAHPVVRGLQAITVAATTVLTGLATLLFFEHTAFYGVPMIRLLGAAAAFSLATTLATVLLNTAIPAHVLQPLLDRRHR